MTSVLHWWPMGVRKSQAQPIATAIRKGSGLRSSFVARLAAIGAMISAVAALFRNGVSTMAATSTSATAPIGEYPGQGGQTPGDQPGATGAGNCIADRNQTGQQHKDRQVESLVGLTQREDAGQDG